ncbi:MAG TPA: CBS domain-containing protein [Rhizomicrobium sp.]|nr:CBS domain-containing protein [Rhizomicrobium sp.]
MRCLSDIICNRHPLVLPKSTAVKAACEKMREYELGAVLVCDENDRLVGIFTARDIVRRVVGVGKSVGKTKLDEVMTRAPVTMTPEKSAIEALRLMWDGGFRHLPLVDGGRIVGVISRADFVNDERLKLDEERVLWENMR